MSISSESPSRAAPDAGPHPSVDPFAADIAAHGGYLYATNPSLGSRLSNRRLTDATLAVAQFRGRTVVDIGCGDGTYTAQLVEAGAPARVAAIDPTAAALPVARDNVSGRPVDVAIGSAFTLPFRDGAFDVAYLRGVLHHMDDPVQALREALRVATTVVVVEPNGYNPVLKLLERYSTYHVTHGEKSYSPRQLDRWIGELGGQVERRTFVGFVPMFCPDWMATVLKRLEPLVERVPLVRNFSCGQYVFSAGGRGAAAGARPAHLADDHGHEEDGEHGGPR